MKPVWPHVFLDYALLIILLAAMLVAGPLLRLWMERSDAKLAEEGRKALAKMRGDLDR